MRHIDLNSLLAAAKQHNASDLHLISGVPPAYRINGEIILAQEDAMSVEQIAAITNSLLNDQQREKFEREWELCISMYHSAAGRVRVTLYRRNGHPELCFRLCGESIPERGELGLPAKVDDLARRPNGLVLVSGPTGSGKTTTLNYMINLINSERRCKIVTIEDPIEFVHQNRSAIIVQTEVLTDTHSFHRALIHVLRQDPDIIVIGEMRDPETIATALTAAETGHLVLATLHSPSATQALERIVGIYEGSTQRQVINHLANVLQGIIAQDLLPSADRTRRVLACELMIATPAVRNLIRESKIGQLENTMQVSAKDGMLLMDNCLADLYERCLITYDTALSRARHPQNIVKGDTPKMGNHLVNKAQGDTQL